MLLVDGLDIDDSSVHVNVECRNPVLKQHGIHRYCSYLKSHSDSNRLFPDFKLELMSHLFILLMIKYFPL